MSKDATTSELAITAFYFNLEDKNWWKFKDTATGSAAQVESNLSGSTLSVKISLGDEVTEQVLEIVELPDEATGELIRQYKLLESRLPVQNIAMKWQGGLTIPSKWKVGTTILATSQPGANPGTGNAVRFDATLVRMNAFKPPTPPLFGIEIKQTLTDVGLGTNLARVEMYFAGSRGLVYATGDKFGKPFILTPTSWYGQH